MAKSLEEYINELKNQHKASGKGSLDWYLEQVRALAAKRLPESEEKTKPKEQISSADALQDAKKAKTNMTLQEAIDFVQKTAAQETTSIFNRRMIGQMLFFQYDAKLKSTLPYWDMFPLTFMFNISSNFALGMNMHYLPPVERARLMMALWSVVNSKKLDDHSRLLITYKLLNNTSKFVFFKPCIKKYLFSQIRSRIIVINPVHWNQVLMLPLSNFQKSSEFHVWQESVNQIRSQIFKENK